MGHPPSPSTTGATTTTLQPTNPAGTVTMPGILMTVVFLAFAIAGASMGLVLYDSCSTFSSDDSGVASSLRWVLVGILVLTVCAIIALLLILVSPELWPMWNIATMAMPWIERGLRGGTMISLYASAAITLVINASCAEYEEGTNTDGPFWFSIVVMVAAVASTVHFLWPFIAHMWHSHHAVAAMAHGNGGKAHGGSGHGSPASTTSSSSGGSGGSGGGSTRSQIIQNLAQNQDVQEAVQKKARGFFGRAESETASAVKGGGLEGAAEDVAEVAA